MEGNCAVSEEKRFMWGILALLYGLGELATSVIAFYHCSAGGHTDMCAPGYQVRIGWWLPAGLLLATWGIYSWVRYFRWLKI